MNRTKAFGFKIVSLLGIEWFKAWLHMCETGSIIRGKMKKRKGIMKVMPFRKSV